MAPIVSRHSLRLLPGPERYFAGRPLLVVTVIFAQIVGGVVFSVYERIHQVFRAFAFAEFAIPAKLSGVTQRYVSVSRRVNRGFLSTGEWDDYHAEPIPSWRARLAAG